MSGDGDGSGAGERQQSAEDQSAQGQQPVGHKSRRCAQQQHQCAGAQHAEAFSLLVRNQSLPDVSRMAPF